MNFVCTAQKPTAVLSSVVGHFTDKNELNLIISKCTRIEIHLLTAEGLQPLHDVPIYGRVSTMKLFRPKNSEKDLLFLTTEHYKFCILEYVNGEIVTRSNGDVQDPIGQPTDIPIGIIDPHCRMIALHLYEGLLKIIPMDPITGQLTDAFNIRIDENQINDIQFLPNPEVPTICVMYQDANESRHLKTYDVIVSEKDFSTTGIQIAHLDPSAALLIPITPPNTVLTSTNKGGVLAVGDETITYYPTNNFASPKTLTMKSKLIKTYCKIEESRILLGDHRGKLYALLLQFSASGEVRELQLEFLGETSCSSCLSYLDNAIVYVGSCFGDPQLIQLHQEKLEDGSFIEVLESHTNLGPIVDFCVVDAEKQGQGQVVTCSGAFKDGSLRIVRNGIGINELAMMELPGLKGTWAIKENESDIYEKYLIVSFITETRVLTDNGEGSLAEAVIDAFKNESQTLFCGNVKGGQAIQITPKEVRLIDVAAKTLNDRWVMEDDAEITVCSCNSEQLVCSSKGGKLFYLEIDGIKLKLISKFTVEFEVACLDVSPVKLGFSKSDVCAIGLWTDVSVRIVTLPDFKELIKVLLGGEIIPRSVMMHTFSFDNNNNNNINILNNCDGKVGTDRTYLFVGLGDGQLVHFDMDLDNFYHLYNRKKISLATQPISLKRFYTQNYNKLKDGDSSSSSSSSGDDLNPFSDKNRGNLFVCSDRPAVIYFHNGKVLFSNVNLKQVNYLCKFHTESFPDALVFGSEETVTLGTIDEIQKLHIRTVPLQEMPRRIAHQESSRSFLVATVKMEADVEPSVGSSTSTSSKTMNTNSDDDEEEIHYLRLLDEQTFDILDSYELEEYENGCSVVSMSFSENPDNFYYIVGTAYALPDAPEPNKGRILIIQVSDGKISIVHETDVIGAVYSLTDFNGKLLACINSRVQVYQWEICDKGNGSLVAEVGHSGHILALFAVARGDFVVVGDLMKSVSLLAYKQPERKLDEIARDFNPNWMTGVEMLDDENYLGAESCFNLFCVRKNSEASTDEERGRLGVVGEYHLGEFVNKFRHGSLVMKLPQDTSESSSSSSSSSTSSSSTSSSASIIFGTVNGAIGVLTTLQGETWEFMVKLQDNLRKVVKGVGGFDHAQWRAFTNGQKTVPARGFVDGDLIETFLDLSAEKKEEAVSGLSVSVEDAVRIVENVLRSVH